MNLIDAIKSGRPLRRPTTGFSYEGLSGRTHIAPGTWMSPDYLLSTIRLAKVDILADDWEIQELTVTITRPQFEAAMDSVLGSYNEHGTPIAHCAMLSLARHLGLGGPW